MHNCDRTCRATVRQLRSAVRIGLLGVPHRQPEERGLRTTEIAELMTRAARRRDGSPRFTIRPIRQKLAGTPPNSRRTPCGMGRVPLQAVRDRFWTIVPPLQRRVYLAICRPLGRFSKAEGKSGSSPWVFPSHTGGPVSLYSVPHMFHGVLKRAAVEGEVPRPTPRIRHSDISVWD